MKELSLKDSVAWNDLFPQVNNYYIHAFTNSNPFLVAFDVPFTLSVHQRPWSSSRTFLLRTPAYSFDTFPCASRQTMRTHSNASIDGQRGRARR